MVGDKKMKRSDKIISIVCIVILICAAIILCFLPLEETQAKRVTVSGTVGEYRRYHSYGSESDSFLDVKIDGTWYLVKDLPSSRRYGLGGGVTYTSEMFIMSLLGKEVTFIFDYHENEILGPSSYHEYVGINSKDVITLYLSSKYSSKEEESMKPASNQWDEEYIDSLVNFEKWLEKRHPVMNFVLWRLYCIYEERTSN